MTCKLIRKPGNSLPDLDALKVVSNNLDNIYNEYVSREQDRVKSLNISGDDSNTVNLNQLLASDKQEAVSPSIEIATTTSINPNNNTKNTSNRVRTASVTFKSTPNVGDVVVPAVTSSGQATTATISPRNGVNSRWRANFIVKGLGVENIDKITPAQPMNADYEVSENIPWGPTWRRCRPPGLHPNARKCSAKNAVPDPIRRFGHPQFKDGTLDIPEVIEPTKDLYLDYVSNVGWQKSEWDRDDFYKVCYAVHLIETGGYFGIPQNNFDFRPLENAPEIPLFNHFDDGPFYPEAPSRKRGSLTITTKHRPPDREARSVWGAYQYISDVWQEDMEIMLPGIFRQHPDWTYPWFAPLKYENAARLWRFKDTWNTIRGMEAGLTGYLHIAQKASVMYMFNHRPVIAGEFLQKFSQVKALNIANTQNVVEIFYLTWEDKIDNKTSWLPRTEVDTGQLGYKISRQFLTVADSGSGPLPPQFIHKQVS